MVLDRAARIASYRLRGQKIAKTRGWTNMKISQRRYDAWLDFVIHSRKRAERWQLEREWRELAGSRRRRPTGILTDADIELELLRLQFDQGLANWDEPAKDRVRRNLRGELPPPRVVRAGKGYKRTTDARTQPGGHPGE